MHKRKDIPHLLRFGAKIETNIFKVDLSMSLIIPFILSLFVAPAKKELVFDNRTYEPEIKSVQLYSEKRP